MNDVFDDTGKKFKIRKEEGEKVLINILKYLFEFSLLWNLKINKKKLLSVDIFIVPWISSYSNLHEKFSIKFIYFWKGFDWVSL